MPAGGVAAVNSKASGCALPSCLCHHAVGFTPPRRPKQAAEAEEAQASAAAASSEPAAGLLPPCVLSQRGQHGGLTYQLHYRVQAA